MNVLANIRSRLGELWWYTLIMLVVQRFGDVINAFIGLWLVPKYVPQAELGAVLPLMQVGGALALPLSILAVTFSKFVNTFAAQGEYGKVKSLIRDVFIMVVILFLAVMLYAHFFMPLVFERMRVADGRLGMLVVASGVLGVVSTFFTNALQALKKFRLISSIGLICAPLRLVTLLVCLPVRALSGYFVGQIVPTLYGVFVAIFGLKDIVFNREIKAQPYWCQNGLQMLKFTVPITLGVLCGTLQTLVESFIVRHRLPDIESAGYYMISRFAEIGSYVGITLNFVLFPMASEQHERGDQSQRLILQGMGVTLGIGLVLAAIFWFFGRKLFSLTSAWSLYVDFIPHLAFLTVILTLRVTGTCFMTREIVCHRFSSYLYVAVIAVFESVFLYCITGITFFRSWIPVSWIDWVVALRPDRLEFVLRTMFWFSAGPLFLMTAQLARQRGQRNSDIR